MDEDVILVEQLSFLKKMPIFREGDPGGCMFAVDSGSVAIVANYGTPGERMLKELHAGDFFGEMGMVRGVPRSATAVAMETETVVSLITWETLSIYFKESPAKIIAIMQQLSQRVAELSDDYIEACGVIVELAAENRRLRDDMRAMGTEMDALQKKTGVAPDDSEQSGWQRLVEEGRREEDLTKYLEAYRAFIKKH